MSETTDNKPERKKLSLSLQGARPVEVKQSFSNRRSKTVQVEHKIARGKKAIAGKASLSQGEMARRTEALRNAQNQTQTTKDELPNLAVKVIKRSEPPAPPPTAVAKTVPEANSAPKEARPKKFAPVSKPDNNFSNAEKEKEQEKQKKTLRLKGDEKRRQGKLTVAAALSQSDDDGDTVEQRGRSLAALKRARDKERQQNLQKLKSNEKVIRDVIVPENITVAELANRMAERVGDVVKALMNIDVLVTPAQHIDADTAELIVAEFGHKIKRVAESDVEEHLIAEDDSENSESRAPIVSIMGHVDHGKTTLLDTLRKSSVAAGEAGGITQRIGAYQVDLKGQKITFLDTPGHEAFTAMRARGANITDIAILVIAADDGVREQTIESINHARAANIPIIVAITKSDKPNCDIAKIYNELLNHNLIVESLNGDVLNIEISAEKNINMDKLLEAILLQAELCELGANPDRVAYGVVIESFLDKGRGNVASLLVQNGTLRQGDIFVAGGQSGRVRALIDQNGKSHKSAPPASAVEVLGLQGLPMAGDRFDVVESETKAREIAEYRMRQLQEKNAGTVLRGVDHMFTQIQSGSITEIPVIIKADMNGSLEALKSIILKTNLDEVKIKIVHGGVGAITESDISLADTVSGFIIGFNVRANAQARNSANNLKVDIRYYSVIYHMAEDLEKMLKGKLSPTIKETFLGYADVKEVFAVSKVGKIAGCLVTEGVVRRAMKVRLLRDDVVIYEGSLKQLKRFKDDAKEVTSGMECGIALENYDDIKAGDKIECFDVTLIAAV